MYSNFPVEDGDPEIVKKIFKVYKDISSENDCKDLMLKTMNTICIVPSDFAKYQAKFNLDTSGKPILKVTKLSFRYEFVGYAYEKGSPFAEKIDQTLQLIAEGHLFSALEPKVKIHDMTQASDFTDGTIFKFMILLLMVEYILASLIFVIEFFYHRVKLERHCSLFH